MKLKTKESPEIAEFLQGIDQIKNVVSTAMIDRTPHLNGEKYLSKDNICNMLHISERTLQDYRDTGLIGYVQIDGKGKIIYKQSEVIKLLEDNYYAANPRFHSSN